MESGFSERTLSAFLGDLGSNSPAPGGGAAAGVSGALGAALGKMVAELTLGKQKYAAYSETAQNASEALTPLIERFFLLADDDAKAYLGYRNALALPKASEEEQLARKAAMQIAIHYATEVPCRVIAAGMETIVILEQLCGNSNPTCSGDLAAAAAEIAAAGKIAWLNVLANLPYFSDRAEAQTICAKQKATLTALCDRCERLYDTIAADLEA